MSATLTTPPHAPDRHVDPDPASSTPSGRRRRWGAWVVVALVAVLLAGLTAAVGGQRGPATRELDPRSPSASGAEALVRVLEQRGTAVDVVRSADRVGTGTVFVDDADRALSAAVARRIARSAEHVVLVGGSGAVLEAFGLDVEPVATVGDGSAVGTTTCAVPEVAAARSVTADGTSYRVSGGDVERCVPTGSGDAQGWGIVRATTDGGDVTLLGTTNALRNDTITTAGNAGLALGLLGGSDRLTWYVPTPGSADAAPTLGDLAPPWVPSAIALLALVAVAAASGADDDSVRSSSNRCPSWSAPPRRPRAAPASTHGRATGRTRSTRCESRHSDASAPASGSPAPPTSTRSSGQRHGRPADATPTSAPCSSAVRRRPTPP